MTFWLCSLILFFYFTFYLFLYLFLYFTFYLFIYLFIYLFNCLFNYFTFYLLIYFTDLLFIIYHTFLFVHFFYLSYFFIYLFIYLFIYFYLLYFFIYLFIYLFLFIILFYLFIYLFLFIILFIVAYLYLYIILFYLFIYLSCCYLCFLFEHGLVHGYETHQFGPTWHWLIVGFLETRAKFHEPSIYCTNHRTANVLVYFQSVKNKFELIKPTFLKQTTMYIHLCSFHITQWVKQYTTCQRTNCYDTTDERRPRWLLNWIFGFM